MNDISEIDLKVSSLRGGLRKRKKKTKDGSEMFWGINTEKKNRFRCVRRK